MVIFFAWFLQFTIEQFFLSGQAGKCWLSANLPLICKKKSDSTPANAQVARSLFLEYFSHPQFLLLRSAFLCILVHFLGPQGIQQFWEQPWKYCMHFQGPVLIQLEKFHNFSQFVWKLFFAGYSANFCKKIVKYPTHFGGGDVIINLRKSFNIKHKKNTKISRLVYISACLVDV